MVWDQLPAQIKILIKQNYQHKVVPEDENHSPHTLVHTCVCLTGFAPYTRPTPEGHALGLYLGSSKLPPGIPPEPLLEHALDLDHQFSSALPSGALQFRNGASSYMSTI